MSGQLIKSIDFEYSQALQVLDLAKKEALSPYIASLLGIIFSRSENQNCLQDIREWLFNYITPYLYSEPRNQADLREKTLAISTYFLVENSNDQIYALPNELLNKYLEYASKQDWYGDTFLAFTIGLLSDKHVISEKAHVYFKHNYSTFLEQQDIQAISQALFLIPSIGKSLRESGLEIIRACIINPNAQIYDKSWGFVGIAKSDLQGDIAIQSQLKKSIYKDIARISTLFYSKLVFSAQKSNYAKSDKLSRETNSNENRVIGSGDIEETQINKSSDIDIAELSLITLSVLLSNSFFNLSLFGIPEKQIIQFINSENRHENGFIQISKSANSIGNILSILNTLVIGALVSKFIFGINIENGQIFSTSALGLGDIAIILVWLDYLFSQIYALIRGESALEGMKGIPIFRSAIHLFKKNEVK